MLYGETGKTSIQSIIEKRMISEESIWIPVDRKNCRDSSELWDVPLMEKSESKYGYPIYQLMDKHTNQWYMVTIMEC